MPEARFHPSLATIDAEAWDALAGSTDPFVAHAFLAGLERHGCIREEWGWRPHHLALYEDGRLLAAAPLYLKFNSHGEYVFDWGWAHAWEQAGGAYYPKLLCAVPYSPIPGPRLLAGAPGRNADALRALLVQAIRDETDRLGLSSAHVNFLADAELPAFDATWLSRFDWQYHWHNRGYHDFDDFLAALRHKKRKNIRHERAHVRQAGLEVGMARGDTFTAQQWHRLHALYERTFDEKGNHPALTLPFFLHLASTLGDRLQVASACRDGHLVAMALFLRGSDTLYGRYWGALQDIPALHFELCYYQGIEHCIAHGLRTFQPGAQGRHKMARGFMPTRTHSRHYLPHPTFRQAVAEALRHESAELEEISNDLSCHTPYRGACSEPPS